MASDFPSFDTNAELHLFVSRIAPTTMGMRLNQQHLRFEPIAFRLVPLFVGVLVMQ